jgi:hypothetical protein
MSKPLQTTQNFSAEDVELHYFFDREAGSNQDILYHDNGATPGTYMNGEYEILNIKSRNEENVLYLEIEKSLGNSRENSDFNKTELFVHNVDKKPQEVTVNNSRVSFEYDQNKKRLKLALDLREEFTTISIFN